MFFMKCLTLVEKDMNYIFVSYSRQDRDFVLRLVDSLSAAGCQIWLDQRNITGRQPFWLEIQEAIEKSSFFLFVISPDSITPQGGAFRELCHATTLKSLTIVPVMARAVAYSALPIQITPGMYQIHDFTTAPYGDALRHVLAALSGNHYHQTPNQTLQDLPGAPAEQTSLDVVELADLVVKSGRADDDARAALCIEIGLSPAELSFLEGAARSFALHLVQFLVDTDNWRALDRLCEAIQRPLKDGRYAARLNTLRDIIRRRMG
jgi:hypothetical protein